MEPSGIADSGRNGWQDTEADDAGGGPSASALAGRAMPYARLLASFERPARMAMPDGWERALDWRSLGRARRLGAALADLRMAAFVNRGARTVAVAILGTRVNLRGVLAVLRRRTFGGSSRSAVAFVRRVGVAFPGHAVVVVGHSSGGGIASHVGAVLGLPTITFNGARTRAALQNDGALQLNVVVRGDLWGDPGILPGRLAGATLWLEGTALRQAERHALPTIVAGLERVVRTAGAGARSERRCGP